MDRGVVEKRLAGARTEGHFITPGARDNSAVGPRKVKTLTAIDPTNLCSDCSWPNVCAGDTCCWSDERQLLAEVGRYRKRERAGQLGGTVADIERVSRATGRAHAVGSGENAHEWVDAIERMVDEADRPIEIDVPGPLPAANQRLMDVLGVTVNVVDGSGSAPSGEELKQEVVKVELVEEESAAELRGRNDAATSSSTSSRRGRPPAKWTRDTVLAFIREYAAEHGHPPTQRDAGGGVLIAARRIFGTWSSAVVEAGFERPQRGKTRYKDSSGEGAVSQPDPRGHARPGDGGAPDAQEPGVRAPSPAPPSAEVAQLEEHRPTLAGDAGSKPALRSEIESRPSASPGGSWSRKRWSEEQAIAAIKAFARIHGRPPMERECHGESRKEYELPAASTIARLFGTFADGIERAGFKRPTRGGQPGPVSRNGRVWPVNPYPAETPPGWIKVVGTGLRYRNADEAYVAAEEIEADGERVATDARFDGNEAKADQAIDNSRALAKKVREAARAAEGTSEPDQETPVRVETVSTRTALLGVLDSLRVLVDAVLPEPSE